MKDRGNSSAISEIHQQILDLEKELELKKKSLFDRIDQSLSKDPPFKGNVTFEEDVQSYEMLIGYSEMLRDKSIVEDWGTKPLLAGYPLLHSIDADYQSYSIVFCNLAKVEGNPFKRVALWELHEFFTYLARVRIV